MGLHHETFRIDDNVEKDLLQLRIVSHDGGEFGVKAGINPDIIYPLLIGAQFQHFAQSVIYVCWLPDWFTFSGEDEEILGYTGSTLGFLVDNSYIFLNVVGDVVSPLVTGQNR